MSENEDSGCTLVQKSTRWMRAVIRATGSQAHHHPPKLPTSFIDSIHHQRMAYRRYLSRLMVGISGH